VATLQLYFVVVVAATQKLSGKPQVEKENNVEEDEAKKTLQLQLQLQLAPKGAEPRNS